MVNLESLSAFGGPDVFRSYERFCAFTLALACLPVGAQSTKSTLPIAFERNQGQLPPKYVFHFHRDGADALFSRDGIDFSLNGDGARPIHLDFAGAHSTGPEASGMLPGHTNYLLGNQPSAWFRNIPLYGAVEYRNLYPGISVRFYGNGEELEHDFVVKPGADPREIRIRANGMKRMTRLANGDLRLDSPSGALVLRKPVAYQLSGDQKQSVAAEFRVAKDTVRFEVGDYDHSRDLVIDPVYVFSTYIGGTGTDVITSVTTDSAGNILLTGNTSSTDFPIQGPVQSSVKGTDAFITKLDPTGETLIYSTYLGGTNQDSPSSIVTDSSGNAIIGGVSQSSDFPNAGSISSPNCQINQDCYFVASITPDGSKLNYSGMIGGSEGEYTNGIDGRVAVDASGNAYLAGVTGDPNFQITAGTLTTAEPGYYASEMFVLKVDPTGKLIYSTLVPGNAASDPLQVYNNEFLTSGISVDNSGNVTAVGWAGLGVPTTAGVVSPSFPNPSVNVSSPQAGFVLQLNATASAINYASYLPGTDVAGALAVDKNGKLWIAGSTTETTLPVSANAYQKTPSTGSYSGPFSGYIMELNPGATSVVAATYLDGKGVGQTEESSGFSAIALDSKGTVYVGGFTSSADFPMQNPFVTEYEFTGTIWEMILAGMSPDLSTVTFGSFLSSTDSIYGGSTFGGLTVDANGNLIAVGSTNSRNFPTTSGSFEPQLPPPSNSLSAPLHSFVAKFDMSTAAPSVCLDKFSVNFGNVNALSSASQTVQVTNCGNATLHITSLASSDPTVTTQQSCTAVAPGAACSVTLTFTPVNSAATSGMITLSDDAISIPQTVAFSGQGIAPKIATYTNPLDLGHLLVGTQDAGVPLTISNQGQAPLKISTVAVNGSSFSLKSQDCTQAPVYYACSIGIVFSPNAAGSLSGSVTIASNDPATPNFVVALTGTGDSSYAVPVLASISSPTVPINAGAANLTLTGSDFYPASVVQLNGVALTSTFVDNTSLQATIPATSLTSLGELSLTVANPTPGGGTSAPLPVTPYAALTIDPSAAVYVPATGLVYAAIPASASANPNTIVPIDPKTLTPGTPISAGNDPLFLAASSDGAYLYVANRADQTVQRIKLTTNTVDRTFPFTPNIYCSSCTTLDATDLATVPGSPDEVLLAQGSILTLYNDAGVVNYIPGSSCCYADPTFDSIALAGKPLAIYGLPFSFGGNYFHVVNLTSSGLQYTRPSGGNSGGNNTTGATVVSDGKLLYTSAGQVWDPSSQTEVGTFPVQTDNVTSYPNMRSITVDSSLGTIYSMGDQNYGDNSDAFVVSVYGMKSLALTGSLPFPQVSYPVYGSLVRWGGDGLAFIAPGAGLTDQELYLLRSSIVGPQTSNPAPVLTSLSQTSVIAGGSAFTLTVSGNNFMSSSLVEWNGSPLATTFVDAQQITAAVPAADIAAAGTAQVTVTNPAPGGGTSTAIAFHIVAAVVSANLSPSSLDFGNQAQGVASATQTVTLSNTGNVSLTISNIAATGDFNQTNTCGTALKTNSSCTVAVTFSPSGTGTRTGALSVSDGAATSPQSVSLTGTGVADVSIGAQQGGSTSSTVKSGGTATYNLALSGATGFSGTVSLGCSGAPQYATCTLNPGSVNLTPGATATFSATVTTSQTSASAAHVDARGFVLCVIPFLALPWAWRRKIRLSLPSVLLVAVVGVAIGLNGCGGGGSQASGGGSTPQNTPPGTYTLTVTATSGSTSVSQNLTLVVQ